MRFTLRHTINTDVDSFWELFFAADYNETMFTGELKFSNYEVLSLTREDDGSVARRTDNAPPLELPPALRRVVGDLSSYIEVGRFDGKTKRWSADVTPSTMADKIKTHVELRVEARGDKRCERIADLDVDVKIFGIGKVMEKFVEQQTREAYDASARFTNSWIADKGL